MSQPEPPHASHGLWLDGDVLMCACPDCSAPIAVRVWLMAADCWNCGASIELSEEQEREALRLLERRGAQTSSPPPLTPSPLTPSPPTPSPPTPSPLTPSASVAAPAAPAPAPATRQPAPPRPAPAARQPSPPRPATAASTTTAPTAAAPTAQPASSPPAPPPPPPATRRRRREATPAAATAAATSAAPAAPRPLPRRGLFGDMPAWLVSLVVHLVLLTLLGLFTFATDDDDGIVLSTAVHPYREEGGQVEIETNEDLQLDLPVPPDVDVERPEMRQAILRAEQDARELRLTDDPSLPDVELARERVASAGRSSSALAARDPRLRVELVRREGGTSLTEAAVARGLRWLALHQADDGRWSLHRFDHRPGCNCGGGGLSCDSAATALALLPFLGAGQTHLVGRYRQEVSRGLAWLIRNQGKDGDLRIDGRGANTGMYAHGQAAIVLCEAYLLTGDELLRSPAQKAIDFIAHAQHPEGGWRYSPGQPGDTSVVGWQLMALQSARHAGLDVPEETLQLANQFLDTVESRPDYGRWHQRWRNRNLPPEIAQVLEQERLTPLDIRLLLRLLDEQAPRAQLQDMRDELRAETRRAGQYSYLPRQPPTPVMTAEALLCRMYLGWTKDAPGLMEGVEHLAEQYLPSESEPNIYYWYYGTQVFHHVGGEHWERWNHRMRDVLVATQRTDGHRAGSWDATGPHASAGGRLYFTSLAICTLEVYYRHLPIFRQIDLD